MKPSYENMEDYLRLVGPLLFEDWKFYSSRFKSENMCENAVLDQVRLLEEIETEKGELVQVLLLELIVPTNKFWSWENRVQIKNITLHYNVFHKQVCETYLYCIVNKCNVLLCSVCPDWFQTGKLLCEKTKTKVQKHLADSDGSLRLCCRVRLNFRVTVDSQVGVVMIPKPDKSSFRSTVNILNTFANQPEEVYGLRSFLGQDAVVAAPLKTIPRNPGLMRMFIGKLKRKLNPEQVWLNNNRVY